MHPMRTVLATAAVAVWLAASGAGALAQDTSGQGELPMMHMEGGKAPTASARGYMDIMTTMDRSMSSMPMSGDPDVDFARMMIPHHQSAIDMAKAYLESGETDPTISRIARDVVASQEREIAELREWLMAHETR